MFERTASGWFRTIRPQDLVWIPLFFALAAASEMLDGIVIGGLCALFLVQVLEPKLNVLASTRGRVLWILLKLGIVYFLIGFTGGIDSTFWVLLLLPVVSAATLSGILVTLIVTALCGVAYLSFLLYTGWNLTELDVQSVQVLLLRLVCLFMVANLANILAEALREQSDQHRRTAENLKEANRQVMAAQEAVRRSDRLAALGQLSAGLAHELRNPLGTIRASAEMLSKQVSSENEVAREVAGFISSEVDRANSLVTRFLQFARPLEIRREKADLSQMLDRAITIAEREADGVCIYRNYAPEIPSFPFDAELMEHVFYNLIVNAAQASPKGGAVTVKSRANGDVAEIAVIDRGSGIAPEVMKNIFNPFFTTKATGVGLGLAIVAKIVDQHGGKIAVESRPGEGSIFCVSLPMSVAQASTPAR